MNIIAIWDRSRTALKSKTIFCLLSDGRFLAIQPHTEFRGINRDGERIYEETGKLEVSDAFPGGYRYDFRKAHFFIKKFGGILIWIQSFDADVDDVARR